MAWTCEACKESNPTEALFCTSCGAPNPTPPSAGASKPVPPAAAKGKKGKGWVVALVLILAVLLVMCIIVSGIVAAIAVPNFLQAKERGMQKRAMVDMRALAASIQAYQVDTGSLPDTGHAGDGHYSIRDVSALSDFLEPSYIQEVPAADPYGAQYQYGISRDGEAFILICSGSDGEINLSEVPDSPVMTSCFEDDIVWEDSGFIQCPDGPQKKCS